MYREPLIFLIMIDDTFIGTENTMRLSLFADDGPVWKRRRNVQFITESILLDFILTSRKGETERRLI